MSFPFKPLTPQLLHWHQPGLLVAISLKSTGLKPFYRLWFVHVWIWKVHKKPLIKCKQPIGFLMWSIVLTDAFAEIYNKNSFSSNWHQHLLHARRQEVQQGRGWNMSSVLEDLWASKCPHMNATLSCQLCKLYFISNFQNTIYPRKVV